jgi:hypothetical protein
MKKAHHLSHGFAGAGLQLLRSALALVVIASSSHGQPPAPLAEQSSDSALTEAQLVVLSHTWDGIWENSTPTSFSGWKAEWDWSGGKVPVPNPPPFTAKWQKIYEDIRAKAVQGDNVVDFTATCVPYGFPSITYFPEEFQFTLNSLNILSFGNSAYRHVYMDGRRHPRNLMPTYTGHSVGRWDGDTLVIDTVGLRADSLIDSGLTHTTQLHVVERMRLAGPSTLQVQFTFDDPQEFVHPWVVERKYERVTQVQISAAADCSANRFERDESGRSILLDDTGKPLVGPAQK